ncbi:hypothetical protein [Polycladidibacter stylochi]|uniref:hypothetical protein n=1 Tax=Polycladidibacter stylochi TaxID=1807766 RepID=UPI000834D7A7|nr:hypothetical protein [Pseudovibrio stylochi]
MEWTLTFAPLLSPQLLWPLVASAALIALLVLITRRAAGLWRVLALLALTLTLFNPALENRETKPLKSVVALITDASASQQLSSREQQTETTRKALLSRLQALPDLEIRQATLEPGTSSANNGTRLFSTLKQQLEDVPENRIAGAILITDGQVHDVPTSIKELGFNAPVHSFITGQKNDFDRRIEVTAAPRFALVGSSQQIKVTMHGEGTPPLGEPAQARLILRQNGEEISNATINTGTTLTLPVEILHAGENIFELEVESSKNELTPLNNRALVTIEGIRENLRVLLVSGSPHAGERTWRNLLKSDAAVDLVHFTILRPPEKQDSTPINQLSLIAFPTRELFSLKINEFDLIIFDRYERRGVLPSLYFENIAEYVKQGGAVLLATGPDYASRKSLYKTPLKAILPAAPTGEIFEQPFKPQLTKVGERHPVTRNLPGAPFVIEGQKSHEQPEWSRWFRQIGATVKQGDAIMSGAEGQPLLILSRVEKGRVATLLSDHVWLWARGFEGGGPHLPLLRRLAHWLMQEPDLDEETLRLTVDGEQIIAQRQTLKTELPPLTITTPKGDERKAELQQNSNGTWQAQLAISQPGLYKAVNGQLTAMVHVGPPNPLEYKEVIATQNKLAPIISASGGAQINISEVGESLPTLTMVQGNQFTANGRWLGLKKTDASELLGIKRLPLTTGFFILTLLLGLVTFMWYREGR